MASRSDGWTAVLARSPANRASSLVRAASRVPLHAAMLANKASSSTRSGPRASQEAVRDRLSPLPATLPAGPVTLEAPSLAKKASSLTLF